MVGDDVASVAGMQFADVDARCTRAVARDGVQIQRGGRGGEQGVFAFLRRGTGMGGDAFELHVQFRGGEEAAGGGDKMPVGNARAEMDGDEVVGIIDNARRDHGFCAAHAFFGGLENQAQFAAEAVFVLHNEMRQRQPWHCVRHGRRRASSLP